MSQFSLLFFFNDTATTEIYTLSLHDALPISIAPPRAVHVRGDLEIEPLRLRQPARPGEQNPIGRPHHEARGERIGLVAIVHLELEPDVLHGDRDAQGAGRPDRELTAPIDRARHA